MDLLPANTSDKIPPYMDVPASLIPGWPGYRTRPGRSGLDYLDSEFELAHMQGLFLRRLFTGKLRTTKPVYLAAMAALGLHLYHGSWSIFQSLGSMNPRFNPRHNPLRRGFAAGFAIVVAGINITFPLAVQFGIVG